MLLGPLAWEGVMLGKMGWLNPPSPLFCVLIYPMVVSIFLVPKLIASVGEFTAHFGMGWIIVVVSGGVWVVVKVEGG